MKVGLVCAVQGPKSFFKSWIKNINLISTVSGSQQTDQQGVTPERLQQLVLQILQQKAASNPRLQPFFNNSSSNFNKIILIFSKLVKWLVIRIAFFTNCFIFYSFSAVCRFLIKVLFILNYPIIEKQTYRLCRNSKKKIS